MALKGSGNVTITLDRKTVEMLRAKKRGLETWDELMCRLGERPQCGIECVICHKWLDTDDPEMSRNDLARANGWARIYIGRVKVEVGEGIVTNGGIGIACAECVLRTKRDEERREKKEMKKEGK